MTSRQKITPQKCLACSGTGYPLVMGEEKCSECMGTGRDTRSDLWAEHCKNCNGRGKVAFCRRDYRPCRECGGSGVLHPRGDLDTSNIASNSSQSSLPLTTAAMPLVHDLTQLIEMMKKDGYNTRAENKILDILWGGLGGLLGFVVAGPAGAAAGALIGSKIGPRMKPLAPVTITVKAGETLGSISNRIFGTCNKWQLIYDANRDRLRDPNRIQAGMQLLIVYD